MTCHDEHLVSAAEPLFRGQRTDFSSMKRCWRDGVEASASQPRRLVSNRVRGGNNGAGARVDETEHGSMNLGATLRAEAWVKEVAMQAMDYMAQRLENTYRSLDARIKKLDRRAHLTPSERTLAVELKRARLAVLDRLTTLR